MPWPAWPSTPPLYGPRLGQVAFEHSAVIEHPPDEVFAWHERPGAIHRLTPPWWPVRVMSESSSLRDGTAVLRLPGGLRWAATHRPEGYEDGRRFTDVLTTPGLREALGWRHIHDFMPEPEGRTKVMDRVDTRLPGRFLEQMFAYRTRQLAGDLRSHRRLASGSLTVAVTGSSGLVGTALGAFLSSGHHRVVRLVRGEATGGGERRWDPLDPAPDLLEGIDAVVHLAGAPIFGRFTAAHKERVRTSRVGPTRRLAEAAARAGVPVVVTASAIGVYGPDRGDEVLTERSERGEGFLADLVADWEEATEPARRAGVRVVTVRTGLVQDPRGGMLRLLRPIFAAGLGGPLGGGRPWMSWVGLDDLLDVYLRAVVDPALSGPINAVAPEPVRNSEYTRLLATVLRRPAPLPVPGFAPQLLLGREGATEFASANQRVAPAKLQDMAHKFRHPRLEGALRHVLGRC